METNKKIRNIISLFCAGFGILSFIANILALIVFSRKKFKNTIFSTYFRIESIYSMLTILIKIDYILLINSKYSFQMISNLTCKLYYFVETFIPATSNWILVLISLDRFVSIVLPTKFLFRKQLKFQLVTCLILFSFNVLLASPFIFVYEIYNNTLEIKNKTSIFCYMTSPIFDVIDVTLSIIIPFILMITFNIVTIRFIFKSRRNTSSTITNNNKMNDIRFAINSVCLSFSFFILIFPNGLYMIVDYFLFKSSLYKSDESVDISLITFNILLLFSLLHCGSSFYLTLIVNSMFRKEFFNLISELTKLK